MRSDIVKQSAISGLYPILDADWLEKSGFTATPQAVAAQFGHLQLPVVQLRCKRDGGAQYQFMSHWLEGFRQAAPQTVVIINDRLDIALALGADGVHVGQDDLPPAVCRQLLGPDRWLGLSTHNSEEIAQAHKAGVDYIGFGPVHSTATKGDTYDVQGYDRLSQACAEAGELPIVGIGGIELETIEPCLQAGVSAVAMISSLWRQDWQQRLEHAAQRIHQQTS
uniref:Thiamine-phosphate synthase n=1 Tax=Magnetococcus massalia (strain MO-1) TaxID=451514 RepID=A0A1S7LQI4_MAGMO|nr:Thiamine-phosphate synthase [Candidatus Magnetococcus massalia]